MINGSVNRTVLRLCLHYPEIRFTSPSSACWASTSCSMSFTISSKPVFPSLFLLLLKHSYCCLSVETTISWLWLAHGVCHLDAAVCNLPAIFIILLVTARFKRWATTATRFRHNGCCIFVISKHQHGNISNSLNHCYIIDLLAHTCDKQNLNCALS